MLAICMFVDSALFTGPASLSNRSLKERGGEWVGEEVECREEGEAGSREEGEGGSREEGEAGSREEGEGGSREEGEAGSREEVVERRRRMKYVETMVATQERKQENYVQYEISDTA